MVDYDPRLKKPLAGLTLAALGVVYGDIGTSPLYAAKETFNPDHGIPLNTANVLGGLSTIFWALMIVVSLKYVILIMRADNKGEGGIMALLALAAAAVKDHPRQYGVILILGVFGASLFYGDAVLTPAISVLSAVEGLEIGTAALKPYVLPIAVGVVIGLFALQRQGTSLVGALFGPVAVLWFLAIAALGVHGITNAPEVLWALNPLHALDFVTQHGWSSFVVLGAVLLAFTGAEALYADMGHFGKAPIRIAWFGLVFPALVLNYFGQGALLITNPKALDNPFYLLAPDWALYPLVGLATAATVIASQATISGTYSLTKQAIQLDFLPRMDVTQTSPREIGQIYIRGANWLLLFVIVAAMVGFGSSTRLASAYGVAVTGTMLITTILTFFVIRFAWGYNLFVSLAATGFFIVVDAAFFSSSLLKIAEGGWFPLALGAIVFTTMTTWHRGREIAMARQRETGTSVESFLDMLAENPPCASSRNRHVHGRQCGRRSPRAAAQLRVQQGTARAGRIADRHHSRDSLGSLRRANRGQSARPWLLSSNRLFRLHGPAGCVPGAGALQAVRSHVGSAANLVSVEPRHRDPHAGHRHGNVARATVRRHGAACAHRWRLLQHPGRAGH